MTSDDIWWISHAFPCHVFEKKLCSYQLPLSFLDLFLRKPKNSRHVQHVSNRGHQEKLTPNGFPTICLLTPRVVQMVLCSTRSFHFSMYFHAIAPKTGYGCCVYHILMKAIWTCLLSTLMYPTIFSGYVFFHDLFRTGFSHQRCVKFHHPKGFLNAEISGLCIVGKWILHPGSRKTIYCNGASEKTILF